MLDFVIPDPGFNQPQYSPEELRACTSNEFRGQRAYPKNPFMMCEATESRTVEESDSSDMNSSPEIVCKRRGYTGSTQLDLGFSCLKVIIIF